MPVSNVNVVHESHEQDFEKKNGAEILLTKPSGIYNANAGVAFVMM